MEENKKRILIVEDEKNIALTLAYNLMQAGYAYDVATDGEEGLEKALSGRFDLILLDLMLPKLDGFTVCRKVREKLTTPIIILTARVEEVDKIMGLDTGADDYVTKPFAINELLSRIRANIRRAGGELINADAAASEIIKIRELTIDTARYYVCRGDEQIDLTKKEYELLLFLVRHPDEVFTREELLKQVWGYDGFFGDTQSVDVTVSRLRSKLEANPSKPEYLFTKRGVGYYFK